MVQPLLVSVRSIIINHVQLLNSLTLVSPKHAGQMYQNMDLMSLNNIAPGNSRGRFFFGKNHKTNIPLILKYNVLNSVKKKVLLDFLKMVCG